MVRAMCGVQLKDRKRSTDLMFMLGLNETIDQLVMANRVRWYGHVLRKEDGHALRRALDFEVDSNVEVSLLFTMFICVVLMLLFTMFSCVVVHSVLCVLL